MNRPICTSTYPEEQGNYIIELENYCDELEGNIDMLRTDDHFYQNKCHKLEKALDKVCEKLSKNPLCLQTKEQLKEWSLKEKMSEPNKYEKAFNVIFSQWPLFISVEVAEAFDILKELIDKTKEEEKHGKDKN